MGGYGGYGLGIPQATVLAMDTAVMGRGLLTLRLMPIMAMEDMADTDSAMVVSAMAMARGLLMPSLTMDTVELTPDTDIVDTAMVVLDMVMASKQRSYGGCQEMPRLMQGTATTNICLI